MHPIFTQCPFKSNEVTKNTNLPCNLFHYRLKQEVS